MRIEKISLSSLVVNIENYRFDPQSTESEAINKMVEDQGDKLYALANDIIENGLSPIDLIIVTPLDDSKKFTVLEGNRRITSLKLLNAPKLISNQFSKLRKRFQKLSEISSTVISQINRLDCIIFEDPSEADIWIKRKHFGEQGGIGTVKWNTQQKDRFQEKTEGKTTLSLQVIDLLRSQENVSAEFKKKLLNIETSNLERLLSDPYVRGQLGLDTNNGLLVSDIRFSEVLKGLLYVVSDILSSNFSVHNIYNKNKRKQYIDQIVSSQKPDLSKKADEQWSVHKNTKEPNISSNTTKISQGEVDSSPTNKNRTKLIPENIELHIENSRINRIFKELKNLPVRKYPNAASVLLRVFIELSINSYIEKSGLITNNALTASASKESLHGKTNKVINDMTRSGIINKDISKGIKHEMNNESSPLSFESLNAYVHNMSFSPSADNLIVGWDNIQYFLEKLWATINVE